MTSSSSTSPDIDKFKYQGKERDQETGYDYFGGRYHDAALGRFMQIDPMAENYYFMNSYMSMGNNPLLLVDPDGRDIEMFYRKPESDFGHIAIRIVDNETGEVRATWSFGPSDDASLLSIFLGKDVEGHQVEGTIEEYLEKNGYEALTGKLITTREQDDKLVKVIEEEKAKKKKYNLYENNCSTTAISIINTAGFNIEEGNILPSNAYNAYMKRLQKQIEEQQELDRKKREEEERKNKEDQENKNKED
jgi:RHS repeat-associated protein